MASETYDEPPSDSEGAEVGGRWREGKEKKMAKGRQLALRIDTTFLGAVNSHLITDLVRVTLTDRLGGEEEATTQVMPKKE